MHNSFNHPLRHTMTVFLAATLACAGGTALASDAETYAIEQNSPETAVGAAGKASLTVVGKNGWHVNPDAPITLTLVAEPGVTLTKAKMTRGDLAESSKERARFDVGFTSATAGNKKITADTRFVMCQEQACKPVKQTVTLAVAIADPKVGPKVASSPSGLGQPMRKADKKATPPKGPAAKPAHAPAPAAEKASW